METFTLTDRKIPQSFGLSTEQISKLQDLSQRTGKSLSEIAREAFDAFFQQGEIKHATGT